MPEAIIRRIGVVSDLHVGSVYGLLPTGFVSSSGAPITQNIGQKYLWQCWQDMAANIGPLDGLIVNGDSIDGEQHKQRGTELCLSRLEDQTEAAVACLSYLITTAKIPKTYVLSGTVYHDSISGREAENVAQRIGAQQYQGLGAGRYCRDMIDLDVDGVVINAMHGLPTSGALYRGVAPDREALWSALAGKEGKAARADCIVRSHVHNFVHIEHPSKHAVVSPCWQLQSSFMRKSSAYRMIPDIGYIVIAINGELKKQKGDPICVIKKTYPLPEPKITRLFLPQTSGNGSTPK
jgi:hypothetical protein